MTIFQKLRRRIATSSASQTQKLAAALAGELPNDATIALHGDLGVGKTTFVQGLARGFGVAEAITSPTFGIFALHRGTRQRTLVHLDAYRLEKASELDALMLDEFLVKPYCLAIEWPGNVAAWLPANTLHLELGITPEKHHTIYLR